MAKSVHNSVLDGALDVIATANLQCACSAEPTTRTEAVTTYNLASIAMTGGDYANADGDTNGRKCTVGAKTGDTVDNSGTATHVALVDGTNLLYVTTCTSQALTAANALSYGAWVVEIADPS
jgi:hypothetical protein